MNLLYYLILILFILIILLFIAAVRVKLVFNSEKADINMTVRWLSSFIKAFVSIENSKPMLRFYLFNKIIFKKILKVGKNKHKGMNIIKLTNPKDTHVNLKYGFSDPFSTGIACGAINIASQFINIDSIEQTPDFMTGNDYIYLDATAKVNIGQTIIRFFKSKGKDE